ncbi:hypothetical protein EX30DRAFT_199799 [Ascodesmis nigricans]|uniref:Uncharacterized protein n=1 Tax=Ascodesmis nigricans TaxID=341454 RepID=A0A4S2MQ35_9PEZI|nr:hypothetical protein EX30DRAFT_199799 [Ascodesmis nigricans]
MIPLSARRNNPELDPPPPQHPPYSPRLYSTAQCHRGPRFTASMVSGEDDDIHRQTRMDYHLLLQHHRHHHHHCNPSPSVRSITLRPAIDQSPERPQAPSCPPPLPRGEVAVMGESGSSEWSAERHHTHLAPSCSPSGVSGSLRW